MMIPPNVSLLHFTLVLPELTAKGVWGEGAKLILYSVFTKLWLILCVQIYNDIEG